MKSSRFARLIFALYAFALFAPVLHAQEVAQSGEHIKPKSYLRVAEERGRSVALELAVREFERTECEGPRVTLVSIAHIGDRQLYTAMQELLNTYDVVLYEAVAPPGTARPSGNTPEERASSTQTALRMVASLVEAHRTKHETYPSDIDELRRTAVQIDGLAANWLEASLIDAWNRPIFYEQLDNGKGFRVISFGADGKPGGDAFDADIEINQTTGVPPLAVKTDDNIQQQLARALGLAFQMNEIDYDRTNWRNSDMDMQQLTAAFQERGVDMAFLDTMTGTSFPAAMAKLLLNVIGALDRMMEGMVSDMAKIMMIELLSDQQMIEASMTMMGEGFTEVLIDLRNQVTMDDLAAIIRNEPKVKSVAIFYGAAHMADFEERLLDQLGYKPIAEQWIPAITVDLTASRLHPRQVHQMRLMMRNMMQQQMRQLQRIEGS